MDNQPDGSRYAVHWLLTYTGGKTADYGETIRKSWWTTSRGAYGERRLVCDWLADVVIVMVETVADDISSAVATTRDEVIGPLERAAMRLPDSLVVLATRVSRPKPVSSREAVRLLP
jgi:hypothetical protein